MTAWHISAFCFTAKYLYISWHHGDCKISPKLLISTVLFTGRNINILKHCITMFSCNHRDDRWYHFTKIYLLFMTFVMQIGSQCHFCVRKIKSISLFQSFYNIVIVQWTMPWITWYRNKLISDEPYNCRNLLLVYAYKLDMMITWTSVQSYLHPWLLSTKLSGLLHCAI